jgi:hypothetical protein
MDRSQLLLALQGDDERHARAVQAFFAELGGTEEPPRSMVQSGASWLLVKVDVFAKSFAVAAGPVAVLELQHVLSQLSGAIH